MKISFNWLKEYVDFDLTVDQLAEKLTMAGIEVEEIKSTVPEFSGITVAEVHSVRKHPNADKLSLCDVHTSGGDFEVICGAPNVAPGQKVPFAGVGTLLPNGIRIKKAKIRGVESVGMICSQEELGMVEHSDGIWELPQDWQTGSDVFEILQANQDYVLDLSITPNRPDAMSIVGIARDVAATLDSEYHFPEFSIEESAVSCADAIKVQIDYPEGGPRYAARVIKDVKIGPSPEWLATKLENSGVRPINNIVDITNFVLLELGQPLHAFDLARLAGNKIIVRAAQSGEKFITLDDKERDLPANTVMICDTEKMVAIGGIMGGQNSEVSEETHDVLLESAYFDPVHIGRSSKKMGLSTEASQRFERGIDPNGVIRAIDRAAAMMAELAGGTVLKGVVDAYPQKISPIKVQVRPQRVNMLLGTKLSEREISAVFSRLEIKYDDQEAIIPTFRPDLTREVDLIEEVARIISFDAIPVREATAVEYDTPLNFEDYFNDFLKSQLRELGLTEVITNSMVPGREMSDIDDYEKIQILNPISDDMNVMRTSLLPGLLKVCAYNINRSITDLRIFELGRVFIADAHVEIGKQPYLVSGLLCGSRIKPAWDEKSLPVDFFDLKGIVESLFDKILLDNHEFILYDNNVYFDREQVVGIKLNGQIIGHFGKINADLAQKFDVNVPAYGFEITKEAVHTDTFRGKLFTPFSKYPFIEKDVAFIVDTDVTAEDMKKEIVTTARHLINSIEIFDVFSSQKLGPNKKSVAFRIRFQSMDRTLQDKEVNSLFEKIIKQIIHKFPARLRDE